MSRKVMAKMRLKQMRIPNQRRKEFVNTTLGKIANMAGLGLNVIGSTPSCAMIGQDRLIVGIRQSVLYIITPNYVK